ncbi:MAG: hypothetical protein E7084_03555 [Bacteroidales bacterium]|nr:hypothetical protein [Bacteroidales bacterium]
MKKDFNINIDKLVIAYNRNEATDYILSQLNEQNEGDFVEFTLHPSTSFPNFNYCYDIVADSNVIGHIYWGHFNPTLQNIYVKYNNKALYFNNKLYMTYIEEKLNLKFEKIANIDIACDFNFNIINKIYKILRNKDLDIKILNKIYGIDDIIPVLTHASGTRKKLFENKSITILSKSHDIGLFAYNKSREIAENGNTKRYITDTNQFKETETTYRLEIRCRHKELRNTLEALSITEDELYMLALCDNKERIGEVYRHLIDRIIMVRAGRKSQSILTFL